MWFDPLSSTIDDSLKKIPSEISQLTDAENILQSWGWVKEFLCAQTVGADLRMRL